MKNSKKKKLSNKKLTIIKVLPKNGTISPKDLDRWHFMFKNNLADIKLANQTGEVEVQEIPVPKRGQHFITLVRIGSDEYTPTVEDLKEWKQVFEDAAKYPDFKIFTHKDVDIQVIDINDVIAVEL